MWQTGRNRSARGRGGLAKKNAMLDSGQKRLLELLGLPSSVDGLGDEELMAIEDRVCDELQLHGINEAGDDLNGYGDPCDSIIVSLPDD